MRRWIRMFNKFKVMIFAVIAVSASTNVFASELLVVVKNDTTWTMKITKYKKGEIELNFDEAGGQFLINQVAEEPAVVRMAPGQEHQLFVSKGDTVTATTSGAVWNKFQSTPLYLLNDVSFDAPNHYAQITIQGQKGYLSQFASFAVEEKMIEIVKEPENQNVPVEFVAQTTALGYEGPKCESLYLANIPVKSDGANVLTHFQLRRELADEKLFYAFTTTKGLPDAPVNARFTPWAPDGDGNTVFLDRHTIACGPSEALTGFKLAYDIASSQIRFEYGCRDVNLKNLKDYETNFEDDGEGKSIFLDRHAVKCPENTVLNAFRLVPNQSNQYKYMYRCGEIG